MDKDLNVKRKITNTNIGKWIEKELWTSECFSEKNFFKKKNMKFRCKISGFDHFNIIDCRLRRSKKQTNQNKPNKKH